MPTILSHAAVPLAIGLALGRARVPGRLLAAGVVAAMLPDFDVVAFKLGIAYANNLGHRGASHSLLFAALLGCLAFASAPLLRASRIQAFLFVGTAAASHPLLDMLTNGGLGVALYWPWSDARHFAPWRVIEVSPIGLRPMLSARGFAVLRSEIVWIWQPALALGFALFSARKLAGAYRDG